MWVRAQDLVPWPGAPALPLPAAGLESMAVLWRAGVPEVMVALALEVAATAAVLAVVEALARVSSAGTALPVAGAGIGMCPRPR